MLTGTLLLPSDFSGIRMDKSTARALVRDLEQHALFLTTPDEILELESVFPTQEYSYLKEAINRGRIRFRSRTSLIDDPDLYPEVRLSPSGTESEPADWGSTIENYVDSPPVETRRLIRQGIAEATSRNEFWLFVLAPMLRAMPKRKRLVDIVDTYMVENHFRYLASRSEFESGLGWLVSELSKFVDRAGCEIKVRFFLGIAKDPGATDRRQIEEVFQFFRSNSSTNLHYEVYVVPNSRLKGPVRDAMHHRRIVTSASSGSMIYLGLDKGISDFNLPQKGVAIRASSTFNFLPNVPQGSARHDMDPVIAASDSLDMDRPTTG